MTNKLQEKQLSFNFICDNAVVGTISNIKSIEKNINLDLDSMKSYTNSNIFTYVPAATGEIIFSDFNPAPIAVKTDPVSLHLSISEAVKAKYNKWQPRIEIDTNFVRTIFAIEDHILYSQTFGASYSLYPTMYSAAYILKELEADINFNKAFLTRQLLIKWEKERGSKTIESDITEAKRHVELATSSFDSWTNSWLKFASSDEKQEYQPLCTKKLVGFNTADYSNKTIYQRNSTNTADIKIVT